MADPLADPKMVADHLRVAAYKAVEYGADAVNVHVALLDAAARHLDELAGRPVPLTDDRERYLFECYSILRRIARSGDWDAEYHSDAVALYAALGDHLWPDGAPEDVVDVDSTVRRSPVAVARAMSASLCTDAA